MDNEKLKLEYIEESYKNGIYCLINNEPIIAKKEFMKTADKMLQVISYKEGLEKARMMNNTKKVYKMIALSKSLYR